MNVRTFSTQGATFDFQQTWDVGFHGLGHDSRGVAAVGAIRLCVQKFYQCDYDRASLRALIVSGDRVRNAELPLLFKDKAATYVLEASTLELVEILYLLRAAKLAGVRSIDLVYAEPSAYQREVLSLESAWARGFSLSDNRRFEGVPNFVADLSPLTARSSCLVAFLGYEGSRFTQALQQVDALADCPKSVVFGVPGYAAGWEMNALANNVATLSDLRRASVEFCPAASVSGALRILENTRKRHEKGSQLVLAPLGTKPHSIATALYLVAHPEFQEATLIWDHPEPAKNRSSDVRRWHLYRATQ